MEENKELLTGNFNNKTVFLWGGWLPGLVLPFFTYGFCSFRLWEMSAFMHFGSCANQALLWAMGLDSWIYWIREEGILWGLGGHHYLYPSSTLL
jgi:hypothetical protein